MEQQNNSPEFPLLEVKDVCDGPSGAWEAKKLFEELLDVLETKEVCTMNFEEFCPKATRKRIMQEIGAEHVLESKDKVVV